MPSGNTDKPVIEDNHDGTVSIKYEPREEGVHELFVKYNGEHVQGKTLDGSEDILIILNADLFENHHDAISCVTTMKIILVFTRALRVNTLIFEFLC